MPNKSPYLPQIFLALLLFVLIILPLAASDTNSTQLQPAIQLVSRERAISVLGSVNSTILFVDMQIAVAERDRRDLVAAVANLASARGVLNDAIAAFDGGDYVKVVELSSEAAMKAQYALVAIPAAPLKPAPQSAVTFDQANSAIKSANETVLFVDAQIADAERARKDVIRPVETLAEARGLLKQASAAFMENDYSGARGLASDATKKAQDALAILSEAKSPEVLTPRVVAVSGTAVVLVALVIYFGPIRGRLGARRQQAQQLQYGPGAYPKLLPPPFPYQQQKNPSPAVPQQPAAYYYNYRQQVQSYPAAQPKPPATPISPTPSVQQQQQQQQRPEAPSQPSWQQYQNQQPPLQKKQQPL